MERLYFVQQDKGCSSPLLFQVKKYLFSRNLLFCSWTTLLRIILILLIATGYVFTISVSPTYAATASTNDKTISQAAQSPSQPRAAISATSPARAAGVRTQVSASTPLDGLGDQSFYTYISLKLTDGTDVKVNVANGNLLVHSSDLHMQGTGINLDVDRYYNSLATSNAYTYEYGKNWTANLCSSQYLDLSHPTTGIAYYGSSNTAAYFPYSNGSYSDAPGLHSSLKANGDGTYTLTNHQSGEKVIFGSNSNAIKVQDKNGNNITCSYSTAGGKEITSSLTDTQGRAVSFNHDSSNRITSLNDLTGRNVGFGYDTNNHLTSITDLWGASTAYGYTGDALTSITDPLTQTTHVSYVNGTSMVSQLTDAASGTISFAYHVSTDSACSGLVPASACTVVTDQNGHSTTYAYNPQWQVTSTKDALGHISTQKFDATTYNVTQYGDALNDMSNFTFSQDGFNNLSTVSDGTGAATTFGYNTSGSTPYYPLSQTDPQGNTTNYAYTGSGNLAAATDSKTNKGLNYTYNTNGTIASQTDADGSGHTTTYGYDTHGNLTTVTQPSPLGQTTITYDAISRVTSLTDGKGQKTQFGYDNMSRVTAITYSNGSVVRYDHDENGNVRSETDATGVTRFQHDALNRITQKLLPNSATITTGYDKVGNLTSYNDGTGLVTYNYDQANRVTTVTESDGAKTTYGYDNANHKTSIHYPNNTGMLMTYDAAGHELTNNSGVMNAQGQISTKYSSYTYTYMAGSNSVDLLQNVSYLDPVGHVNTYQRSYSYDTQNRLTNAVQKLSGNQVNAFTYGYDNNGNLTSKSIAASNTQVSYNYNTANELTSSTSSGSTTTYSYDGNGNLTGNSSGLSITYNALDQATSMNSNSYGYSGSDQSDRVAVNSNGFVYSGLGLSTATTASGTTEFTRCSCGMLINERTPDGKKYYYLFDGLGSIVGMTDSSSNEVNRYDYDPYGNMLNSQEQSGVNNPWKYAGGYLDSSTGLYKYGIRYYDPTTGRWTQRTPVGGSLQETLKANPYVYAADDPVNEVDPSGRWGINQDALNGCISAVGLGGIAELIVTQEFSIPLLVGDCAVGGGGFDWFNNNINHNADLINNGDYWNALFAPIPNPF